MSRIGKLPIAIPAGVTVNIANGVVTVKGKLGELSEAIKKGVNIEVKDGHVVLTRDSEQKEIRALHGLYRAKIANMVKGVSEGFEKTLVINGVGYKATQAGDKVMLTLGLSHQVCLEPIPGIKFTVTSPNEMKVFGIDKAVVGQVAANIRAARKPEPYHNYGIHYSDEVLIKKEGKTAGK
jgi:large subunit ribosomal protein L6